MIPVHILIICQRFYSDKLHFITTSENCKIWIEQREVGNFDDIAVLGNSTARETASACGLAHEPFYGEKSHRKSVIFRHRPQIDVN